MLIMKYFQKFKFIVATFLLITFIISIFTFDSNLRRSTIVKLIEAYDHYNFLIIRVDIRNRNFASASKKILNYINFSQKVSKGKNKMMQGIYDITELASRKTYTQEEFNQMEKVYIAINDITDDIYMNQIWLARSLADNDIKQSILHLKKALNLSRSNEEAYREIIRIYFTYNKNKNLLNKYCKDYFKEMQGSLKNLDTKSFYEGNYTFSIILNDIYELAYIKNLEELENYVNYQIYFEDLKSIKKISLVHNFFSGSEISIKNIIIKNKKSNLIEIKSLNYDSFSSYILDQSNNNEIIFISVGDLDQIINFYFEKKYDDVEKISFDIKLKKLPLTNSLICSKLNEN